MTFFRKLWMCKRSLIFVVSLLSLITGAVIYLTVLKDYGKSGGKLHILTRNGVEEHDIEKYLTVRKEYEKSGGKLHILSRNDVEEPDIEKYLTVHKEYGKSVGKLNISTGNNVEEPDIEKYLTARQDYGKSVGKLNISTGNNVVEQDKYLTVRKDYGKSGQKLHILTGNNVLELDKYPSADGRKRVAPVPVCLRKEALCENVSLDTQKDHAIAVGSPANYSRPKIVIWAKQRHCINWTLPTLPNGDGGCDLTFDRNELEKGDAVVFFMKCCYPMDLPDPSKRRKDQAFVWWSHESPWTVRHYYRRNLTEYNKYFNWTMTYRMDSDVLAPMWPTPLMDYLLLKIGRDDEVVDKSVLKKPTLPEDEFQRELKHLISRKTKFAAWVVTNCGATWGARERQIFVRSLEKEGGFTIERFGKCVKKEIPFNFPALLQTISSYKFYFAFENSLHCQDYLTEKTIYNSLVGGNVPVIFGPKSENTAKILPKHSYIHVEDFKNIRDLGLYLKYLDGNDTAYSEYFNWWKEPGAHTFPRFGFNYGPRVLPDEPSYRRLEKDELQDDWLEHERFGLYHLCRKLKNKEHLRTSKTISSLADWFYGNETLECLNKL